MQDVMRRTQKSPRKKEGVMAALLIVLGIASATYGASIMLVNSGTSFFAIWYVIAALCLVPGISQVLLPTSALASGICLTVFILLAVVVLVFLCMCVRIMGATFATPPSGLDCLLVLGAQVRPDGSPSVVLRNRLETALAYLVENPSTRAIVCGGKGPNEPISEAACMAQWLEERGIAPDRIASEDRSTTTAENIRFAQSFFDAAHDHVGIVTNNFHVYRAMRIAAAAGVALAWGVSAHSVAWYLPNNLLRECFGIIKNTLRGTM